MKFTYDEVSKILESLKDETENNRNYQFLYKGIMQKMWDDRVNKKSYFCIYLNTSLIDNIKFDKVQSKFEEISKKINTSNFIEIDAEGNIINNCYKDYTTEKMKQELMSLSSKNFVFFFGEGGITRYISGCAMEDSNIFYSSEDRKRFLEKKDISQLDQVIREYSMENVSQQVNYMCFFADNPTLKQIDASYVKRNILKNKPEQYTRDHLKNYLNEHMRYTFTIEPELGQSKRELDIYFDVKGEMYFIEIKWLGVAINDTGTGLTQPYTDYRAREGVTQSLEYIQELMNTSEASLRCGCLAIFDARDKKTEIDFQDFRFIRDELQPYRQCFKLLEIIPLNKRHSA